MKFKTLNNGEIRLDIVPSRYAVRSRGNSRSVGQYNLGRQIRSIYGMSAQLLEEFPIPGERLFLDFFMPNHKLAFEFQGEQHDTFNPFFHGSKAGFERSKERDARKREWCKINNIILVEVRSSTIDVNSLREAISEERDCE